MKRALHWTAKTLGLFALSAALSAQPGSDFLLPVYFSLYLTEDSPLYPFAIGHPCGRTVTLRANTIPVEVAMVRPVWAYELTRNGKIKTRWAMPVDGTPLAVDGDRLTIHQFEAEDVVFVTASFGIGTTLDGPDRTALENRNGHRAECPLDPEASEMIRHYLCSEMTDATTGEVRIVAYPMVCT
jgi:hypothetical protein